MAARRLNMRASLLTCLAAVMALTVSCTGYGAKSEKKYRMTETELQSELMAFADRFASYLFQAALADLKGTIQALTALLAAVEKTAGSPGIEKINQLVASSMDQAGKEGEALIDLSFFSGSVK